MAAAVVDGEQRRVLLVHGTHKGLIRSMDRVHLGGATRMHFNQQVDSPIPMTITHVRVWEGSGDMRTCSG